MKKNQKKKKKMKVIIQVEKNNHVPVNNIWLRADKNYTTESTMPVIGTEIKFNRWINENFH